MVVGVKCAAYLLPRIIDSLWQSEVLQMELGFLLTGLPVT